MIYKAQKGDRCALQHTTVDGRHFPDIRVLGLKIFFQPFNDITETKAGLETHTLCNKLVSLRHSRDYYRYMYRNVSKFRLWEIFGNGLEVHVVLQTFKNSPVHMVLMLFLSSVHKRKDF